MPQQYEPVRTDEQDDWLEDPEELPRRPRRRLLGAGGRPVLALLSVLLIACGFIGGVLVEKGQSSSSSSSAGTAASLASRFAALRGGTSNAGAGAGAGASTGASGGSGGLLGSGAGRPTAGTVAYVSGKTLYVTNAEGNTVKVTTSAGTSVTKTVKADIAGIHPGETVTVTGATGANGAVNAEAISVGSGSGLRALLGGLGGRGASKRGGGGEASLFGG
jgi:hypothetical protein